MCPGCSSVLNCRLQQTEHVSEPRLSQSVGSTTLAEWFWLPKWPIVLVCVAIWLACPAHIAEFLPTNCSWPGPSTCVRRRRALHCLSLSDDNRQHDGCFLLHPPLFISVVSEENSALWNSIAPIRVSSHCCLQHIQKG